MSFTMFKIGKFQSKIGIGTILFTGLVLRLLLFRVGTLYLDFNTYVAWSNRLVNLPLKEFYNAWSDYLPGYLYVLFFLGKIKSLPIPAELLYKLPAIISDVLTGYLIYKAVKKLKGEKHGKILSAMYMFNPAVFANSALWGQADSLTALFSLLSVYLLNLNWVISSLSLSFGTLIKPQAVFAAPLILVLMFREKWPIKKIFYYISLSAGSFLLAFLPFSSGNFFEFLVRRFTVSANQYPYLSVNAFNFYGFFGMWKQSGTLSFLIGISMALFVFLYLVRNSNKAAFRYVVLAGIFYATFLFLPRMHERHLLPLFAPLIISVATYPLLIVPYIVASLIYLANLRYSYVWVSKNFFTIFTSFEISTLIIANLLAFAFMLYVVKKKLISKILMPKFKKVSLTVQGTTEKIGKDISENLAKKLIAGILFFALLTRLFSLGSPSQEYFDEVYHAFTAKLVLHADPKAWEWWNPHPQGFAYEWTHPPVAKLGMAASMYFLGESTFAYRLPGALLGVGAVLMVYLLALEFFKDRLTAVLSSLVFSLDGLPLVMSRIGMNDSYMLFFVLLSLFLFLRKKNFWSAFFWGLAISSKWSTIWSIPIFVLIYLSRREKFKLSHLFFLLLPPLIYLGTYFQMFLTGHGLDIFWGMQKQMWWYHTNLKATHPYSSVWWQWPILVRPIYLYTSSELSGMVSRIYAMGNPFVFWTGLVSVLSALYYGTAKRQKAILVIVFSYLVFFVPWSVSPRVMFLYHYLPSTPFMAIALAYILRRNKRVAPYVLAVFLVSFIYFYPHWAGLNVSLALDKSYYWFASWR